MKRLITLTDFTGTGEIETITDFEYTFECAQRLSQALHQATQPAYAALTLANLGYVRCLTGRHIEAMQAMEAAAETLEKASLSLELDGLHAAIRACRTHTALSEPADESAETVVAIVEEHADLRDVTRIVKDDRNIVPAFVEMVGRTRSPETWLRPWDMTVTGIYRFHSVHSGTGYPALMRADDDRHRFLDGELCECIALAQTVVCASGPL
ncbi:hypothetical protein ACWD4K_17605 [Streptomyces gelaticus]